jgi:DNA-binding response OmpR family regulator
VKILVADDQTIHRRLARKVLERVGHEVTEVEDGEAAWQRLCGDAGPTVALLDWAMPGMSGPDLCRRIRARADALPPYLILVTARDRPEEVAAGLEAGGDDYVVKPFYPAVLRARVGAGVRILELRSALAERVAALESALAQVTQLQGLFPMCAWCRKIRNDQNFWESVEAYVSAHTDVRFTHGICPDCRAAVMGAERDRLARGGASSG